MSQTMEKNLTILFAKDGTLWDFYKNSVNDRKGKMFLAKEDQEKICLEKMEEAEIYQSFKGNYDKIIEAIFSLISKEDFADFFPSSVVCALENDQINLVRNRVIIHLSEMLIDCLEDSSVAKIKKEIVLDLIKTIIYFINQSLANKNLSSDTKNYLQSIKNNLAFLFDDLEGCILPTKFGQSSSLVWNSNALRELDNISLEDYNKVVLEIVEPLLIFCLYNIHSYYEEKKEIEEMLLALKIIMRACLLFYNEETILPLKAKLEEEQFTELEEFRLTFEDCLISAHFDKSLPKVARLGRFHS